MKKSDVRIGMRVVPIKKSVGFYDGVTLIREAKKELEKSPCWSDVKNTRRPYLFVKQIESEEGIEYFHLGPHKGIRGGADFFLAKDFVPYISRAKK